MRVRRDRRTRPKRNTMLHHQPPQTGVSVFFGWCGFLSPTLSIIIPLRKDAAHRSRKSTETHCTVWGGVSGEGGWVCPQGSLRIKERNTHDTMPLPGVASFRTHRLFHRYLPPYPVRGDKWPSCVPVCVATWSFSRQKQRQTVRTVGPSASRPVGWPASFR